MKGLTDEIPEKDSICLSRTRPDVGEHLMRTGQATLAACVMFLSQASGVENVAKQSFSPGWPVEIKKEHRPGTYWWSPGSAFDTESIDWNLENMREAGIANVHIVPIYGAKGYEDRYIEFLSPKWMEMLDHIVKKGRSLEMNVDMTTGTGWCFGGPGLDVHSSDRVAHYDPKIGTLSFKPGKQVKRAAPGGEGSMINPYSPAAMEFYLKRFSRAFDAANPALPRAQYHDSFEYRGDWCPELLQEFKARRGYDLAEYLDLFFTDGDNSEKRARLKCDYRATLAELHYDCISVWVEWARTRGMITRNQAHGSPGNLLDLYAACDVPETEMFGAPDYPIPGFRRDPTMVRKGDSDPRICMLAASAAHIAHEPGKQWVSSESCTWLREHWHATLGQVKLQLDQFFTSGVNHIFYHGTCYSPKDAPWPGWFFYASTKFDPRNSFWRDFRVLNDYVTRCQSILQVGRPANDVLVYWPIHDLWTKPDGTALKFTVHHTEWMAGESFGLVAQDLISKGYTCDFVSDRLLQTINFQDSSLLATGGSYRAIVVPACRYIPVATMRRLADLAEKGATVIFEKEIPRDVPGLGRLDERRKKLVAERVRIEKAGAGVATNIPAAIEKAQVPREVLADAGLNFIRRKVDDGYYYFIANQTAGAWDDWTELAVPFVSAVLLDPMTGTSGVMAVRHGHGRPQAYLQLQPGESKIIRVSRIPAVGTQWVYLKPGAEAKAIAGEWHVEFIEGGPDLPASRKFKQLASWTDTPDEEARRFAGTARYSTTFTIPDNVEADDWLLELGDVRESARVEVNGHHAGALISLPFSMPVGRYLKPGENTLRIDVTNLSANRIRDLDLSNVNWKIMRNINIVTVLYKEFDASKWPLTDSGLLGPVRLIPMNKIDPHKDCMRPVKRPFLKNSSRVPALLQG